MDIILKNEIIIIELFLKYESFSKSLFEGKNQKFLQYSMNTGEYINQKKILIEKSITINDIFLKWIIDNQPNKAQHQEIRLKQQEDEQLNRSSIPLPKFKLENLIDLFRLFIRDWSIEGIDERDQCYSIFLKYLNNYYKDVNQKSDINILCPGGGLGRLSYEISKMGFKTINNDFNLLVNVAFKAFFSNKRIEKDSLKISPFIHETKHQRSTELNSRVISFPSETLEDLDRLPLLFTPGDFFKLFKTPSRFDCVCTSFFLENTNDSFKTIKRIHKILVDDGIWLNFGTFQYNNSNTLSHFSYEELLGVIIPSIGFNILENRVVTSSYTQNISSLSKTNYQCIWFVAKKIKHTTEDASIL